MTGQAVSRRRFLQTLGLAAAGVALPPTPPAARPTTAERPEYFVPLGDYHELPPECYAQNLIRPFEIIVHWDGNRQGRELWLTPITYETLQFTQQSAHFAVDYKRIWQLLPMFRTVVQESYGAKGYNWAAINVELAGTEFDQPGNAPPASEVDLAVRLVARLMEHYAIAPAHVAGHFERDLRGDKRDPGAQFMAGFRTQLVAYRASRSPLKQQALAEPGD
ncbi:MAG: N-acetylmuramoyl-L-alanine amidase [Anaerolineales bacterium]|nr:N-acetylmuramoyl-L-alanine amidase [Anaerolineales bacterium]